MHSRVTCGANFRDSVDITIWGVADSVERAMSVWFQGSYASVDIVSRELLQKWLLAMCKAVISRLTRRQHQYGFVAYTDHMRPLGRLYNARLWDSYSRHFSLVPADKATSNLVC